MRIGRHCLHYVVYIDITHMRSFLHWHQWRGDMLRLNEKGSHVCVWSEEIPFVSVWVVFHTSDRQQASAFRLTWQTTCTVHLIKKLMFYTRSTAIGTGMLQVRVRACYSTGTGIALVILLGMKSEHDGSLRLARRFRTFVVSRTGQITLREGNWHFKWVWLEKLGTSDTATGVSWLQVWACYGKGYEQAHRRRTLMFLWDIPYLHIFWQHHNHLHTNTDDLCPRQAAHCHQLAQCWMLLTSTASVHTTGLCAGMVTTPVGIGVARWGVLSSLLVHRGCSKAPGETTLVQYCYTRKSTTSDMNSPSVTTNPNCLMTTACCVQQWKPLRPVCVLWSIYSFVTSAEQ